MAVLKIEPVHVQTQGGLTAVIDGIDILSRDCLVGKLTTKNGVEDACWDENGTHRGGGDPSNFRPLPDELVEVVNLCNELK